MSPNETLLRSYSYKKNITAVLKACIPYHPETCHQILAFLPALRETRKNIQYLTSEEIQKVKKALVNSENPLTLCDKANFFEIVKHSHPFRTISIVLVFYNIREFYYAENSPVA